MSSNVIRTYDSVQTRLRHRRKVEYICDYVTDRTTTLERLHVWTDRNYVTFTVTHGENRQIFQTEFIGHVSDDELTRIAKELLDMAEAVMQE